VAHQHAFAVEAVWVAALACRRRHLAGEDAIGVRIEAVLARRTRAEGARVSGRLDQLVAPLRAVQALSAAVAQGHEVDVSRAGAQVPELIAAGEQLAAQGIPAQLRQGDIALDVARAATGQSVDVGRRPSQAFRVVAQAESLPCRDATGDRRRDGADTTRCLRASLAVAGAGGLAKEGGQIGRQLLRLDRGASVISGPVLLSVSAGEQGLREDKDSDRDGTHGHGRLLGLIS
jgi:hypothetical protein